MSLLHFSVMCLNQIKNKHNTECCVYFSELTEYLLSSKVDLKVKTDTGDTVLHGAVHGNKPKIVKMLIDAGKDVLYN